LYVLSVAEIGGQWSVVEFEDSGVWGVPSVAELMFPDVSNAARSLEMSGNITQRQRAYATRTQTSTKSVWKPKVLLVEGSRIGSEGVAL